MGIGWGADGRRDCRKVYMCGVTQSRHSGADAVFNANSEASLGSARTLGMLATHTMLDTLPLERGGSNASIGSGDGYHSNANGPSDVRKVATTTDATPCDTEARRTDTRVHQEAAGGGPHP